MKRPSWYHVTTRSTFLALALFLGLIFYYLPNFLELDEFRPQVQDLLESAFHCHAIVGNITGELVPYPGLVVGHVVLIKEENPPRMLASVAAVHLWLSMETLSGHLRFRTIRFIRPRFILHRQMDRQGQTHWDILALPQGQAGQGNQIINEWQVRNGTVELWNHSGASINKWVADQFSGSFLAANQIGALTGKIRRMGRSALMDIHYNAAGAYPLEASFADVDLQAIQAQLNTRIPVLDGSTDFLIKARFQPTLAIQVRMEPVLLPRLKGARIGARATFEKNHLSAHLETGTTAPMTLALTGDFGKNTWNFDAHIKGYDAALVRGLYQQTWIDRLEGPGVLDAHLQTGSAPGTVNWNADGRQFNFEGTTMRVPEWSANGEGDRISAYVHATTPQGGMTEVTWDRPAGTSDAVLQVDVATVTVRQVLDVFHLHSKPVGYEPWLIDQGSMKAVVHDGQVLEIQESGFDLLGMHLDLSGNFGLGVSTPHAHIQGDLQNIPVATVVESFFKPPSPLTGRGKTNFNLDFPLSSSWVNGLSGPMDNLEVDQGVLRTLKTIYRIISVLNLGNYLRFRLPQVTAEGIEFESIKGGLKFQNGVLSVDDLFLKSPNMNVDANGSVDIPGKRIKATLRLEMFRFLEDILRDVPITHWIFKKPSKIFLPLVVTLEGPWDDVEAR